ncbi:MAG: translation initiation factor IF-3, partial [Myxococcota bacterium]
EVKLRPRTDDHDLDFKLKNARRFLTDGDKVKVTVMYRGREMVHRQLGREQLNKVVELLGPIATVENPPRMEGRFLSMILVPNREGIAEMQKQEAEAKAAEAADGIDTTEEAEETASAEGV